MLRTRADAGDNARNLDDSANRASGDPLSAITPADNTGHLVDESDIAGYLLAHPEFFTRHGEVLAAVKVPDPYAGRAVSLHERQLSILRERHRHLEVRLAELLRVGQENDAIAGRLQQWTRELLLTRDAAELPDRVCDGLGRLFKVPQVAIRLWQVAEVHQPLPCTEAVLPATRRMANHLKIPYCGLKGDIQEVKWLQNEGQDARSVALLVLRAVDVQSDGAESHLDAPAVGLIVLGSEDPDRFQAGMGTEFLERLAQTASVALARIIADPVALVADDER